MSFSRGVGSVLRAAVATPSLAPDIDHLLARSQGEHLSGLARAAAFHGIVGYVDRAVESSSARDRVPAGERAHLREATLAVAARHAAIIDNLRRIGIVFDATEIPWLVVKGPVLAASAHGAPVLRVYEDVDVVVPVDVFGDALKALEQEGATILAGEWQARVRARAGEVPLRLPSGLLVDLHWHLVNAGSVRDHFEIPMDDLFARRTSIEIDGLVVPTLESADALAHVALHMVLSGSNRLIWLKDLERIVARQGQDVLVTAAVRLASWGGALAMEHALGRTAHAVGLPPGSEWPRTASLAGRAWLAMAVVADCLSPVERQEGGPSILRVVSRAVREDALSSARALAGKGWRWLSERLGPLLEPVVLPASGTATSDGRAQYLADVVGRSQGATDRGLPGHGL